MKLLNLIEKMSFDDVKLLLTVEPYNLIIKEDKSHPTLYMITYVRGKSNLDNEIVKLCRGIVLEKGTNQIVCYSFNMSADKLEVLDNTSTSQEVSYDGTQIKLFHYNNEWIHSTTRCIDARNSNWDNDKTFYDLFMDCEKINYERLNKNHCYSFVMCHPLNKIVVKYDTPFIVHVLTRDMITFEEVNEDIGVMKPALIGKTEENGLPLVEGLMLRDKNNNRFKIETELYKKVKDIRGNNNNKFYRYLQLKCGNQINEYLQYFPEQYPLYYMYDLEVSNLAQEIRRYYINRHINKSPEEIPKNFKKIIYNLHGRFIRTHDITTLNIVLEELLKLHPSQIHTLYTTFKTLS